jgi:hypothetical protein
VNPTGRIGGSEVFESSRGNFSPRGWLRNPEHTALVKRLCVQRGEQLLVARNGASLLAKPLGFEEDWERVGRLTALLKELPPDQPPVTNSEVVDGIEVDLARLPSDLQPLIPLIRKWATSDDEVRSALLTAASDEELRELRDAPTELWDLINAYLDENVASDEPYEATVLDSFAQGAMEADSELENRSTT